MRFLFCFLSSLSIMGVLAQPGNGPKVLVVISHPDDETLFPVTLYKIVHDLKGTVDLALLTDGQGGYRNTELASQYYGINLIDSNIGRAYLPAIRKRELMASGKIIGIRNFFFFDQVDDFYSQNPKAYEGGLVWDVPMIEKKLDGILARTAYDYVMMILPEDEQHGHHKSSGLLALRAVNRMKKNKPIVLGALEINKSELQVFKFEELAGYPESRIKKGAPVFTLDRTTPFGFMNLMSYMVVHDWIVAEYKSQGDTQNNYIHKYELEAFWYFDLNNEGGIQKTQSMFEQLENTFPATGKY